VRTLVVHRLGTVPYASAHALQEALLAARFGGASAEIGDTVLLLQHPPVVTFGRGADARNLLVDRATLEARGIALHETGRGGDVTYHGPGQLVAYPILDLKPDRCDVRRYVRDLAKVMIGLAGACGLGAGFLEGDPKLVGVWVDAERPTVWPEGLRAEGSSGLRLAKIGAIGVRISRWVTMHGFAFNVHTDLEPYRLIVPCGISDRAVTSVDAASGHAPAWGDLEGEAAAIFGRVFEADVRLATEDETLDLTRRFGST
jgi:lipoyl(octanoyl) transferase